MCSLKIMTNSLAVYASLLPQFISAVKQVYSLEKFLEPIGLAFECPWLASIFLLLNFQNLFLQSDDLKNCFKGSLRTNKKKKRIIIYGVQFYKPLV